MVTIENQRLTAGEYIDFLKRTDLGSQYPKERFEERIQRLVEHVPISLAARDQATRRPAARRTSSFTPAPTGTQRPSTRSWA